MRTQQYSKIEALVAKYETLAADTNMVKEAEKRINSDHNFFVPDLNDLARVNFGEQLLGRVYSLKAGNSANPEVLKYYSLATSCYIKGLLTDIEEQYLVEQFDAFVDYAFDHFNHSIAISLIFDPISEWSSLTSYLLENKSGKVFVPYSNKGREFVGLNNCELTVDAGFIHAAIRSLACGFNVNKYELRNDDTQLLSGLNDGQFDVVIASICSQNSEIQDSFNALFRIVKDGGDLLLCVAKEAVLSKGTAEFRNQIIQSRTLGEVIQLPSGGILLHIVKKPHDTIVMCDASSLTLRSNDKVIDIDAFIKEVKMANQPERDDNPIMRRYSYDKVNEHVLLPQYYLSFPESGTPMGALFSIAKEMILTNECHADDKVVTVNHLSNVFTKGAFKVEDLTSPKLDRLRRYYKVSGPAVIMAVSDQNIAIGYTTENKPFLVPRNLYALLPKKGIDVRYLACMLFNESIRKQLTKLVYGKGISARLAYYWTDLILTEVHSSTEQQKFVQDAILKDYAAQEDYVALQEKGFKHAIRLRKHALSQNISSFDSMFRTLEHCMKEHKGNLNSCDQISPVSPITVADAMSILHSDLEVICERVAHLTDEQDWGACEAIEPQQFIENFEAQHNNLGFRFSHSWENFETNCFANDIFDKETGKLLFHEGESINTAWFPRRALLQVFDNIVSNAREHGFTDKSRQDYVVQSDWTTDGLNMLIKISNNGTPLPRDVNSDLVLEYGYTTALNQRGHGGIGGGEISEIMHKFGGDVTVISTPENKFTVTYVLTLPLTSLY